MPSPGLPGMDTTPSTCSMGFQHRAANGMLGAIEFEQRFERRERSGRMRGHHREQLQRCRHCNSRAPYVRVLANAERVRHVRDLLVFREAARCARIRLNDVECMRDEHVAKAEPRELALAARDGNRQRALHIQMPFAIFRRHGFLEPADI